MLTCLKYYCQICYIKCIWTEFLPLLKNKLPLLIVSNKHLHYMLINTFLMFIANACKSLIRWLHWKTYCEKSFVIEKFYADNIKKY